jgi:hypothetical protein
LFRLNLRKARCLGHLWCVQDDRGNFLHFATCNETFWCGECIHILVLGQMTMNLSSFSLGCKFCHSPPFCVAICGGRIYYVVHRLQFMLRTIIHLGVHNHLLQMESVGSWLRRLED